MLESILDSIRQMHQEIMKTISKYNDKINRGEYLECCDALDVEVYFDFLAAHIVSLLIDDESRHLSNTLLSILPICDVQITHFSDLQIVDGNYHIKNSDIIEKGSLLNKLVTTCFNSNAKNFIQEVCAQDIIHGGDLAKKISSIMRTIGGAMDLEVKGEEVFFHSVGTMGKAYETAILRKFDYEYRNRGALIRNRVFRHQYAGRKIIDSIILSDQSDEVVDYRTDRNFCQSAVLHIGVESTGSSGTGFIISEDGYALTCAHVVDGAKEIYATIINNDGYSTGETEGFEVYDAGDGEVVYSNKALDIAVLKMHHYGHGFLPIEKRNVLPELGEEVVVFGYPLGYEVPHSNFFGPNISFYKGYVSSNQIKDGNSITFLDIDIKSGNSGSPVISTKTGKVIGIISGIRVGGKQALTEKMPYMIPIQHFLELMK